MGCDLSQTIFILKQVIKDAATYPNFDQVLTELKLQVIKYLNATKLTI